MFSYRKHTAAQYRWCTKSGHGNQLEKEKEVAVNTAKHQFTTTINKTNCVKTKEQKLKKNTADLNVQYIAKKVSSTNHNLQKKASKLGKYAKKVASANHNL